MDYVGIKEVFRSRKSKNDRQYNDQNDKQKAKRQTMVHITLHSKLKTEQHESHTKLWRLTHVLMRVGSSCKYKIVELSFKEYYLANILGSCLSVIKITILVSSRQS